MLPGPSLSGPFFCPVLRSITATAAVKIHDDEAYSLDILFGLRSNFLFDYINHAGAPIASLAVGSFLKAQKKD